MQREKWSYAETERRFELPDKRAAAWERIYLAEGPEGFAIERRGRSSKGRPSKLPQKVEEDLLAEVQHMCIIDRSVSVGTILYAILNTAGYVIATLEFYQDTLVRPDGMYTVICTE